MIYSALGGSRFFDVGVHRWKEVVHGKEIFLTDAGAGIYSVAPIIVIVFSDTYYLAAKISFASMVTFLPVQVSELGNSESGIWSFKLPKGAS